MKTLTFFNHKGGVGKTTLTAHVAHMLAQLGVRVVVLDYDPQCNVSLALLEVRRLSEIQEATEEEGRTVAACLSDVRRGRGLLRAPALTEVAERLWLLPGHLDFALFEQPLAECWPRVMAQDNQRALDVVLALSALAHRAAAAVAADVVLLDVGPSLGALNHAALIACDVVIVPLMPDAFSLQALRNIGPLLREWRTDWQTVGERFLRQHDYAAYAGHRFMPLGYVVQQHTIDADRSMVGKEAWDRAAPYAFAGTVMGIPQPDFDLKTAIRVGNDPHCLAQVPLFPSLVGLAQFNSKPMFALTQADAVFGNQSYEVAKCKRVFEQLAKELCRRLQVPLPILP